MPLKRKVNNQNKLLRFRLVLTAVVFFLLLFPFVLQQTFFPFFRFGMFAEPVTRTIQKEHFLLIGNNQDGRKIEDLQRFTGIQKSKMDYLLRNHYYRKEVDFLLKKTALLLPEKVPFDTLRLLRILDKDTIIVAEYGL